MRLKATGYRRRVDGALAGWSASDASSKGFASGPRG